MKLHVLTPALGSHQENAGFLISRNGYILEFNTRILYLKRQEDSPGWIELRILGFGFGVSLGSWADFH